jgi:hypothetical protein
MLQGEVTARCEVTEEGDALCDMFVSPHMLSITGVPRNFVGGGSTNLVDDRGQREHGSRGFRSI